MRQKKYKIGEMKKRCKICNAKLPDFIQDQYKHILDNHLDELPEYGIMDEEIQAFKKGFTWEPSTNNQQQWSV